MLGWVVERYNDPAYRETVYGNYPILYHFDGERVVILTVRHGATFREIDSWEGE